MCGYYRAAMFIADLFVEKKGKEMEEKSKTMGIIKLLPAMQYVFPEIKNAFYRIDQDTKEEFVVVSSRHFIEGISNQIIDTIEICVTCDSVAAMYDDVWKECKRRFL